MDYKLITIKQTNYNELLFKKVPSINISSIINYSLIYQDMIIVCTVHYVPMFPIANCHPVPMFPIAIPSSIINYSFIYVIRGHVYNLRTTLYMFPTVNASLGTALMVCLLSFH